MLKLKANLIGQNIRLFTKKKNKTEYLSWLQNKSIKSTVVLFFIAIYKIEEGTKLDVEGLSMILIGNRMYFKPPRREKIFWITLDFVPSIFFFFFFFFAAS